MFNNDKIDDIVVISAEEVDAKLENWPGSYYEEKEAVNRKALLEEALKRDLPTNDDDLIRKKLFDLRYVKAKDSEVENLYYDMFMRAYFELRQTALRGRLSSRRIALRDVKKSLKAIGYLDEDGNMAGYRDILTNEIKHMAMYYIDISMHDRMYTSILWGFGTRKKADVHKKIAREFYEATDLLAFKINDKEILSVWIDGLLLGFKESIPDWENILSQIRKEI